MLPNNSERYCARDLLDSENCCSSSASGVHRIMSQTDDV